MDWWNICFYLLCSSFNQVICSDIYGGLILTPYIRNGNSSEARHLSKVNSKHFLGVKSYSGFITVNEEYDSDIFFWYFPHKRAEERPWIIWLQGGPGYSSLLGLFVLIGPLKIEDGEVRLRPDEAWLSDYSLLFIDNPVGAGFSYTRRDEGYTTSEDEVGEQLLEFLVQFLQVFPELKEQPLFIAGQSYAGKYVPALGYYIHRHNNKDGRNINLKGISIGNGLIDPRYQLAHSELCRLLGILGDREVAKLQKMEREGLTYLDEGRMVDAANKFNESMEYIKAKSGISIYNLQGDPSSSTPEFEEFIQRPNVRSYIHVGQTPFNLNNQHVYYKMLPDFMNTTRPFVELLLEHYGVLLYNGQLDLILPYSLSKRVIDHLQWSQREQFEYAPRLRVRNATDNTVMAYSQSGGNLVSMVIRKAGHMVPRDQLDVFKYVLNSFVDEFK